jgi:DNA-binding SARP family transcriptional activator/predicted ATPase
MLELNLLGVPEVSIDGQVLTFTRRGSIALLAYLALSRRAHAREALATLLAGDSFEEQARKYLSNVLVDLRQQLGGYIVATRQSVSFDRARPYRLDVSEFQTRAIDCEHSESQAELQAAIDLYRDEFLAGLALSGMPDFEAWQLAQREELRGQYMQLLRTHVDVCMRQGAWNNGIQSARRILAEEPWLEDTHRQLILMLAHSGQRQAALAQYQACRRILREELGVEPSLETAALFNRLRAAITPPTHNLPVPPSPLVGRTDALRLLGTLLTDPECRLVTITGLSGSGKTRLALEVARAFAAPTSPPPEQPFPDGVYLINLDDTTPDSLAARMPTADSTRALVAMLQTVLSATSHESVDALPRAIAHLSNRAMLLVLDNVDPAVTNAAAISELLAQAPHLKLLVTAPVPLHIAAERVLHVDGLRLPANEDELESAEASALFIQEARRATLDFELIDDERPHLLTLCRLLGGFPLALVLAARWAPMLSCSALVGELETGLGLDVLATTHTDLPERHRSLTRILERALAHVPGDERALAQRLAAASTTRDVHRRGAECVVPRELVPQLRELDEQALLRVDPARGTVELHPLLRPYARRPDFRAPAGVRATRTRPVVLAGAHIPTLAH